MKADHGRRVGTSRGLTDSRVGAHRIYSRRHSPARVDHSALYSLRRRILSLASLKNSRDTLRRGMAIGIRPRPMLGIVEFSRRCARHGGRDDRKDRRDEGPLRRREPGPEGITACHAVSWPVTDYHPVTAGGSAQAWRRGALGGPGPMVERMAGPVRLVPAQAAGAGGRVNSDGLSGTAWRGP